MKPVPVDNKQVNEAMDLLKPMLRKKQMVEVTIMVPLEDIDFTECHCESYEEASEFWGNNATVKMWETDLAGASWEGHDVTFEGDNYDIAESYLIDSRG